MLFISANLPKKKNVSNDAGYLEYNLRLKYFPILW